MHIGTHRQHLVHLVGTLVAQGLVAHQGQQTVEVGIVSKAQVSGRVSILQGLIGIADDMLPQRDGRTGSSTIVIRTHAVDRPHAQVVLVVNGAPLAIGQHVVERDVQLYVLHVAGNGVQLRHQLVGIRHFRGVLEQSRSNPVARKPAARMNRCLESLQLG